MSAAAVKVESLSEQRGGGEAWWDGERRRTPRRGEEDGCCRVNRWAFQSHRQSPAKMHFSAARHPPPGQARQQVEEDRTKVRGRTAKRLGKWWEVLKEKHQREIKDNRRPPPEPSPDKRGRYEWLLEIFAEKLVKERQQVGAAPLHHHHLMAAHMLPSWMSSTATNGALPLRAAAVCPRHSPAAATRPWLAVDAKKSSRWRGWRRSSVRQRHGQHMVADALE
ncbi:hypothetical protein ZWY2020_053695 [Hordeum vulgare]|nr:hypothetical protein ZWY2020_053695 [Hordeum vulgare]